MLRALVFSVLTGCTCAGEDPVIEPRVSPQLAPAMPPAAATRARPDVGPAPDRALWGLVLGQTDRAGIDAWVHTQGLECEAGPAARRTTHQTRCRDAALPSSLTGRNADAAATMLLLVRTDEGPLHHVSSLRRHAAPIDAIRDYQSAIAQIQARLGAPTQADPAPPAAEQLQRAPARFATSWIFSDLEVGLSLTRMSGPDVVVRERWDVPGVEAGVPPRPGSAGHIRAQGLSPHSPHGIVP